MDLRPTSPGRRARSMIALAAVATIVVSGTASAASTATATATGPSTSVLPYILPVADGVKITSLFTVGDEAASNGFRMVGIPDGLGARRDRGKIIVTMNQELQDGQGIARRHGLAGAFVSRLVLDPKDLEVEAGSDLIDPGVRYWDYPNGGYVTAAPRFADLAAQDLTFGRFCSGTLSDPGVLFNERTGRGYRGQIWFANEEDGDNGRSFAVTEDGRATALPRLGLFSWENTIPAANRSDTTLVMGQEDGPTDGSQPWVYVGTKTRFGSPVDRAGLTNGLSFVLDAVDPSVTNDAQWRATYPKGTPGNVVLANVPWSLTGALQNGIGKTAGLSLNRIEDGHWDPRHRNDFYFVTTQGGETGGTGADARDGGGLWRLRYKDIEHPAEGAELTLLLDGSEVLPGTEPKFNKPDNMAIDEHGNVLIQEDPGGNNHLARIVAYRIGDGHLGVVARFDPAQFDPAHAADPAFLTIDEESSGIIDTGDLLGDGTFLFDAQVHTSKGLPAGTGAGTVQELVERGQLLLLRVKDWHEVYGD